MSRRPRICDTGRGRRRDHVMADALMLGRCGPTRLIIVTRRTTHSARRRPPDENNEEQNRHQLAAAETHE